MADISVVEASVQHVTGAKFLEGVFGETTTSGQTAYLHSTTATSPPTYGLCDTNGTDELALLAGVFMNGGAAGQPCFVLAGGDFNPGVAITRGQIYVATATPGGIALAADLASGWKTSIVGIATTTSNIKYIGTSPLAAIA
jgi:hypothetical protein